MDLKEKEEQKNEKDIRKLFRKSLKKNLSINSRIKATYIIGQMEASCRQRITDSSCTRKETIYKDILIKSRNGDTKSCNLLG